jgi:hypothetical protein
VSVYTDWFIADKDEASAIASIITTEEHSFADWPHLQVKGIIAVDLMTLWAILRREPYDPPRSVAGELLFQGSEEGPFAFEVEATFIEALANVPKEKIILSAAAWAKTEELSDWPVPALEEIIDEFVEFARRARAEGKPVLEMAVL